VLLGRSPGGLSTQNRISVFLQFRKRRSDGGRAAAEPDAARARETHAGRPTRSPTSPKLTLRQLILGRDYDVEQAAQGA
jgi:hypothetical protein